MPDISPAADNASNLKMMSAHGKTFFWASGFMPGEIRRDLAALYLFCRTVDDSVDKAGSEEEAIRKIATICRQMDSLPAGDEPVDPSVAGFLELSRTRQISKSCAMDLIAGVSGDIGAVRLHSQHELLRYCYQVAATVGMMICCILDVRSPNAQAFAIDLGIAMQLTNIARDVVEDCKTDRIYLPSSLISHDTVEQAVFGDDQEARKQTFNALKVILEWADKYYRSADKGICYLPISCRLGILTASRAYEKIGEVIKSDPENYWVQRAFTTKSQKQAALICAAAQLCFNTRYWSTARASHEQDLHRYLKGLPSFESL